jgi:hypothetical protein
VLCLDNIRHLQQPLFQSIDQVLNHFANFFQIMIL